MAINRCAKCGKFIKGDGVSIGGKYYHKKCLVCDYCGGKLTGSFVNIKGKLYHAECNPELGRLVCAYCRKTISGSYYILKEKYYHKECYHSNIEKKCLICGKAISGTYTYDDWGNYAHKTHGREKTRFCYSCGRIISGSSREIGTNMVLCGVCTPSSITTTSQVEACRTKVLSMFMSFGITGVPDNIPIELKKHDQMDGAEGRIHYLVSAGRKYSDFRIDMTYGFPEVHFLGVLAHEMLHSWLLLYGREVTEEECEGFCNLGCAYVYQKINTPHSLHLLKRMYESEDRIYGEGYRLQKERFERLGWKALLESLRR